MVMEIWAPLLGARNGQERSDMFPQGSEAVAQVKEQLQLGPVDEQNAQYLAHAACAASTLDQDPAQPAPGGFSGNQVLQASQPFNEHDFPNDLLGKIIAHLYIAPAHVKHRRWHL